MTLTEPRWVRSGAQRALGLTLVFCLLAACTSAQPSPSPGTATPRPADLGVAQIKRRAYPSLSYGIQAFLWWNETTRVRDLELVRMMRFQYVKQVFSWRDVRPDPALPYNWKDADEVIAETAYRSLKLIVRLGKAPDWAIQKANGEAPFDLTAFGMFCGDLATRYKGKIAGYQVWNEPNLSREWNDQPPSASGYVKMLAACARAIKAADPEAVIISAGLAPTGTDLPVAVPDERFLVEMYRAGLAAHYDVLGLHAPGYRWPPGTPPDDPRLDGQRWQAFRHVEDMRAIMVANGEGHKQVAILELGWTTDLRETVSGSDGTPTANPYRWHAVTEREQAEYMVGAYRFAAERWRPWVGLVTAIYLADGSWTPDNEEYWWAITQGSYQVQVRQAFIDLANMAQYRDDQVLLAITDGRNPYTPMPPRPR